MQWAQYVRNHFLFNLVNCDNREEQTLYKWEEHDKRESHIRKKKLQAQNQAIETELAPTVPSMEFNLDWN